jgi:hypothetical protein
MFSKLIKPVVVAAAALMFVAPSAFAADTTNVTVAAGTLTITNPLAGEFGSVTLTGVDQDLTASLATFEVNDSRGTGVGWHVNVSATRFQEHDGTALVTGGKTLPTSSLTMSAPTVTADGTTSPSPSISTGAPYTIDGGSAVKVASAAVDSGMGKYDFSATTLTLTVPADAYAKTYQSTVTVDVVTAP